MLILAVGIGFGIAWHHTLYYHDIKYFPVAFGMVVLDVLLGAFLFGLLRLWWKSKP